MPNYVKKKLQIFTAFKRCMTHYTSYSHILGVTIGCIHCNTNERVRETLALHPSAGVLELRTENAHGH
jgi:hypothetical protein